MGHRGGGQPCHGRERLGAVDLSDVDAAARRSKPSPVGRGPLLPTTERAGCSADGRPERGAGEEIADLSPRAGKPRGAAIGEVDVDGRPAALLRRRGAELEGRAAGRVHGGHTSFIRRSAVRRRLGITPWNYPLMMARYAGPALARQHDRDQAAPPCPNRPRRRSDLRRRRLPRGCLREHLRQQRADRGGHRRSSVAEVSVTGSERAGAAVAEIAGRNAEEGPARARRHGAGDSSTPTTWRRRWRRPPAPALQRGPVLHRGEPVDCRRWLYDDFLSTSRPKRRPRPRGPASGGHDGWPALLRSPAERVEGLLEAGPATPRSSPAASPTRASSSNRPCSQASSRATRISGRVLWPGAQVQPFSYEDEAIEFANRTPLRARLLGVDDRRGPGERVANELEARLVWINGHSPLAPSCPSAVSSVRASARIWPLRRCED